MPPFGNESFGGGRFGRGAWARRVLWGNVPGQWQAQDALLGDPLQDLLGTWADELEGLRDQVTALPDQRDPYLVRGTASATEWLYFTSATWSTDPDYGPVCVLAEPALATGFPLTPIANAGAWTPYSAIDAIGPGWLARGAGIGEVRVVRVKTRAFDAVYTTLSDANAVTVAGAPLGAWPADQYGVTIGLGNGGWGTTTQAVVVLPGAPLRLRPNATAAPTPWLIADAGLTVRYESALFNTVVPLYDVPAVPYDGTGTLCVALNATDIDPTAVRGAVNYETGAVTLALATFDIISAGVPITADWHAAGFYLAFSPPALLPRLARDFGFEVDAYDPEAVQRSTVAHAASYLGQKAAWDSYRIRGAIAGFTVDAQALYALADATMAAGLPADAVFTSGGLWYTTIAPRLVRFDDIAADARVYNAFTGAWDALVDDAAICLDYSADGLSTGQAFALDVAQGRAPGRAVVTVTSARALTTAEAAARNLPGGAFVTVKVLKAAKADFTVTRAATFGLSYLATATAAPALADPVWWIDRDEGVAADADPLYWQWTVCIGLAPTAPLPAGTGWVAVRYDPGLTVRDCAYCRTHRVRLAITPAPGPYGAEALYGSPTAVDEAARRLIGAISSQLLPIHVRVLEYALVWDAPITVGVPTVTVVELDV
jgi:hypothetical protein